MKNMGNSIIKYAKYIDEVTIPEVPIRLSRKAQNLLHEIRCFKLNVDITDIESETCNKPKGYKTGRLLGRCLKEERIILLSNEADNRVLYHEIGHFLFNRFLNNKKFSYTKAFLYEYSNLLKMHSDFRYLLNVAEYFSEFFADLCMEPKETKYRMPHTYQLFVESDIVDLEPYVFLASESISIRKVYEENIDDKLGKTYPELFSYLADYKNKQELHALLFMITSAKYKSKEELEEDMDYLYSTVFLSEYTREDIDVLIRNSDFKDRIIDDNITDSLRQKYFYYNLFLKESDSIQERLAKKYKPNIDKLEYNKIEGSNYVEKVYKYLMNNSVKDDLVITAFKLFEDKENKIDIDNLTLEDEVMIRSCTLELVELRNLEKNKKK